MRFFLFSLFFLWSHCGLLYSQDIFPPPTIAQQLQAQRTNEPITVDGILQEKIWQAASQAKGFRQIEPYQGEKAAFDTEVRLLFDDNSLYI
ncbi:MAG TPA: hypothetical protein PLQ21_05515, partial [Candidatus Kapabacteria bacterium]|nr:hypothetical protein [Candidatus Kapabacteria bacterium]